MRNGSRSPIRQLPPVQEQKLTPKQLEAISKNKQLNHAIVTTIGFIIICPLAGFLITLGQHLAYMVLK